MKKLVRALVLASLVLSMGVTVYADEAKDKPAGSSYTIANNGNQMTNPYEDSKLPTSFKDVTYYDCAIPYGLNALEIGGAATKIVNAPSAYKVPSESRQSSTYMGGEVMYEGDMKVGKWAGGAKKSYESDTGLTVLTDKNGVQYYVTAIQGFFYSNDTAGKSGFPSFRDNRGQLFDVVLTDGTVIHMVVGDNNANEHTNGGTVRNGGSGAPAKDGKWTHSKVKIEQYTNIYSACNLNQLEMWGKNGCSSKFKKKFGLSSKKGEGVKIAYYRMYNKKIGDAPAPINDSVKSVSFKIGNLTVGNSGGNESTNLSERKSQGLYKETHFVRWKSEEEMLVAFPKVDNLGDDGLNNIEDWKSDLNHKNKDTLLVSLGRNISMWFGIIFEIWMLFMYMSYWFDRLNNIFEVDLLRIVSFGKLRISPTEDECTFSITKLPSGEVRTINHRKMLTVCLIGLFFGAFIISGGMFSLLDKFVTTVLSILD